MREISLLNSYCFLLTSKPKVRLLVKKQQSRHKVFHEGLNYCLKANLIKDTNSSKNIKTAPTRNFVALRQNVGLSERT